MKTYDVRNKISASNLNLTLAPLASNSGNVQDQSKNLVGNHSILPSTNLRRINIDSRILPLFRTPLLKGKIVEIQENTRNYSLNNSASPIALTGQMKKSLLKEGVLGYHNKTNLNKKFTNNILKLFYKGLILYNLNLKGFLLQESKLNLILNIKNDKLYKLNTQISTFFKLVNKLIFEDNRKTVLPKVYNYKKLITKKSDTLFVPFRDETKENYEQKICKITEFSNSNQAKVSTPNTEVSYASNKKMLFTHKISTKKISMEIENNKELIKFGIEIINNLDFHISQNEILINKTIKNQKILDLIKNTSLLHSDFNSNLNYNLINYNSSPNRDIRNLTQLNSTSSSQLLTQMDEFENKNLLLMKMFNSVNKSNEIKIEHTINSIIKNKEFDYKTDSISINSNPISVVYNNNSEIVTNNTSNSPIINKYLQAMSKYNMKNKGISIYYSNIVGYKFNSNTNKLIKNIYNLLAYSFKSMYCLISKPVFVITSNKIIIQLFYYLFIPNILKSKKVYKIKNKGRKNLRIYLTWKKRRNKIKRLYRKFRKININTRIKLRKLYLFNITKIFPDKFKKLCEILSNLFKKSVELDLIRLHYPYNDSNILANLLAILINRIKLRIIAKRLFGKAVLKNKKFSLRVTNKTNKLNIIPAFLSGINIKVSGRLLNNKIVPRKTVKTIRRGAVAKGKINYLDVARYTNKNKRGAYSITVSSGHKYF
jgi:hypothetical protein